VEKKSNEKASGREAILIVLQPKSRSGPVHLLFSPREEGAPTAQLQKKKVSQQSFITKNDWVVERDGRGVTPAYEFGRDRAWGELVPPMGHRL